MRQRKRCSPPHVSPTLNGKPNEAHRGCWRGLAIIFSMFSDTHRAPRPKLDHQLNTLKFSIELFGGALSSHESCDRDQKLEACDGCAGRFKKQAKVAGLEEEVRRDLKCAYKAHLDNMQYELSCCSHMTKDNGANQTTMDQQFELGDPNLEAVKVHAKISGWNIEPHEIEFHEKIGQGTTADIYKGTWRGLDIAVKCLYPHFFEANEFSQTWFLQELETLSRQRHPFVLRLIGTCLQPPKNGWIITELLNGKTLTEWLYGNKERKQNEIRSKSVPPLKERILKGLEIAQGMQYLHEQKPKVIHRDLKRTNIFLDDSMHVRVADFGHAWFLTEGEQALTGEVGTYVYMAPEVIRCKPYDEKCDMYSFGIILNELITGEHPYSETSYGPCQIALEVAEGRLRRKLAEEDHHHHNLYYKELIQLICCAWDEDASARPTFAIIASTLRELLEIEL